MRKIRLLDVGEVPALRTHALYHSLHVGPDDKRPDTIVLSVPKEHYVSLGRYQEIRGRTDTANRRGRKIPIFRRQIGGGAILFGPDHQIFQTVSHWQRSANSATRMYQEVLRIVADTYRAFGVDAHYLPVSAICVRESRISASAVGRLNDTIVLISSIAYENNPELERTVLGLSAPATTISMRRELGTAPDRDAVKRKLIENFERGLEAKTVAGSLTDEEEEAAAQLETILSGDEWTASVDSRIRLLNDAAAGETCLEGRHITSEGVSIRADVRLGGATIHEVVLSGDFSFYRDHLDELEQSFCGASTGWDQLMTISENFYLAHQVDSPGAGPTDWVNAIHNAISRSSTE